MSQQNHVALTIDVEDWFHTPAVTGSDFSQYKDVPSFMREWKGAYDYLSEPTERLLRILEERGLIATFFIVGDISDYYPGLVEKIVAKGHEIACHGLHHECKINTKDKSPRFTQEAFLERTLLAKQKLESISGQEIKGYRAPGAYFGKWMIDPLKEAGFSYDSSLNPNTFFCKSDFPLNHLSTRPFKLLGEERSLLELPWPSYRWMGLKFPTAGGPFLRFFGANYIALGLDQSLERGDTLFYFHSIDFQEKAFPNKCSNKLRRPFYWAKKGECVLRSLETLLERYQKVLVPAEKIVEKYLNPDPKPDKTPIHEPAEKEICTLL